MGLYVLVNIRLEKVTQKFNCNGFVYMDFGIWYKQNLQQRCNFILSVIILPLHAYAKLPYYKRQTRRHY